MRKPSVISVCLLLVSTLLAKDQKLPPSVVIKAPLDQVKSVLVSHLATQGYNIVTDTPYQLAFSKEVTGVKGALAQVLMGNSYSETPKDTATFMFAVTGDQVMVTAAEELSVRMAFGNVNRINLLDNKKNREGMQQLLNSLKARLETPRTGGIIGLDVEPDVQRVGDLSGMRISVVTPGGPAEAAGVKVGDLLMAVDGNTIQTGDALGEAIIPLKPGTFAKLTVVRAGARQEIAVEVWDRATVKWDGKTLSRPTSAPTSRAPGLKPLCNTTLTRA